jgi:predicted DNA-binding protein (MmcQ/YjbR family)
VAKVSVKQAEQKLIKFALTYPEAVLEHPWGHDAVKVKGKMFATFGGEEGSKEFSMTVKLPVSSEMALTLPWVEPTGYGQPGSDFDFETMQGWIDQSYRAVAPKTLVKAMAPAETPAAKPSKKAVRKR